MSTLGTLWRLQQLTGVHREGVAMARAHVEALVPARWREPFADDRNPVTHVGRNFFSLLLLSAYRALDLREDQLRYLAAVNHTVRAIVTAADNLIDGEDKPVLPLSMPAGAARFRNSLALLAWGVALERVVAEGVGPVGLEPQRVADAVEGLMGSLIEIGGVEAEEEAGVDEVVTPGVVVARIHEQKGGQLLGLAFVVPRELLAGDPRAPRLAAMHRGVHAIGLALQHVDDVTDLAIDVADRRHNLLQSEIVHRGSAGERAFLERLRAEGDDAGYREACADSVGRVVARALDTARRGFAEMEGAGYPLGADEAMAMVETLFKVRGEEGLLVRGKAAQRTAGGGAE